MGILSTAIKRITKVFNYEGAIIDRTHPAKRDKGSGDTTVALSGERLRAKARDLDRNHDIARGALDALVDNIVGRGIRPEPMIRTIDGALATDINDQVIELWKDWVKDPEVTGERDYYSSQRIKCRTLFRDGEVLQQFLEGNVPFLKHSSSVPFSIELLEPDYMPIHYNDLSKGIVQGVQKNAWGKPTRYYLYKQHPADLFNITSASAAAVLKSVSSDRVGHIKLADRIGQTRGVTAFASVITRLADVKDYEEYERVAAKVAASMAGYIKKGTPDMFNSANAQPREMDFVAGMIFDDLREGEEIGTIDTNRPNSGLSSFRDGQLRAAAGGVGVSYSSLSNNYEGSYSSRRQENVEQHQHYGVLWHYFSEKSERPVWDRFISMALLAGLIDIPSDVDMNSVSDVVFSRPPMPVIDPSKDSASNKQNLDMEVTSRSAIIRANGDNPIDVRKQIESERETSTGDKPSGAVA